MDAGPNLIISEAAVEHLRSAVESWRGDPRDLGLALAAWGRAILLITDGHSDQIAMIEAGAQLLGNWKKEGRLDG